MLGRSLRAGQAKSCGCRRDGRSYTGEYRSWKGMIQRCRNPKNPSFAHYGGRGIAIYPRWDVFDNFLADMGPRPTPRHTIERVDNNGPYSPENCRWATWREQVRNRRDSWRITFNGETLNLTDWAARTGIERRTISARLKLLGWSIEDALTVPVGPLPKNRRIENAA